MRACWAATLLVLVQPSPASCATCRGTSVVPRVLAPAHRHLRKSPSVRQPFAEISGSISFSPLVFPFPETVPNFLCHFKGSLQTKAESQSRESVNFPTHSAVLSHDGLGNRCKKWARACQAGAPPRAASLIGVHASQSGALFVALQPEKREHFRGTEPTIYQPKAAPRPLYIPGTKTRIPAEPVTCERICGST
jgi:hypothetical protein